MKAALPTNETERLAAVRSYCILDTPREIEFDELTEFAAAFFDAPVAVVNIIDEGRQWFKAEVGLGVRETPLETSFCSHAILSEDLLVVPDARTDPRFYDNPLVMGDPGFHFYAGALLKSDDGLPLGTLCILDYKPRDLDARQRSALRLISNQVMAQLNLRRLLVEAETSARELRRANVMLEKESQRKSRFLTVLAHEIRNPLMPIMLSADLIDATGDAKFGKIADRIRDHSNQLKFLVDGVNDVAELAAGKVQLRLVPTDVASVVTCAVEAVESRFVKKNQDLEVRIAAIDAMISADKGRLIQVISNLLTNASRYTPEGGRVVIECIVSESDVQISVADNGIGISPEEQEAIFELFAQGSEDGANHGLGVGLAVAREFSELHGGRLAVFSDGRGKGSTFTLTIPRPGVPAN